MDDTDKMYAKLVQHRMYNRLRQLDQCHVEIKTKQGEVYSGHLWFGGTPDEVMIDLFHFNIADVVDVKGVNTGG